MSGPAIRVCLVRTQGPVNLGLVARVCGNLGIEDLRLVSPQCEVNCPEARKFANHARDFLLAAPVHAGLEEAVGDCQLVIGTTARQREGGLGPLLPAEELPAWLATRPAQRLALVFGNEADGLNADELAVCQAAVHLPTPGWYESYNLSHAVAITLYLLRGWHAEPPAGSPALTLAERHRLAALERYWLGTLERFHYFRRTTRDRWAIHMRRMFNRLPFTEGDVDMLFGMFAQFHYHRFGDRGEALMGGPLPEVGDPDPTLPHHQEGPGQVDEVVDGVGDQRSDQAAPPFAQERQDQAEDENRRGGGQPV